MYPEFVIVRLIWVIVVELSFCEFVDLKISVKPGKGKSWCLVGRETTIGALLPLRSSLAGADVQPPSKSF